MPDRSDCDYRWWQILSLLTLALLPPANVLSQDRTQAEGLALLRGAAAARSKVHSFRVELTMTYNPAAGEDSVFKIVIEQSGNQRRLECLPGSREASVNVLAPDHVRRFIRDPHEDLCVYTIKNAVGARGVMLFDPRGLGLSGSLAATDTVDGLFWLDIGKSFTTNGEETLNGTHASRVVVTSVVGTSEYWISQPNFRVHRRTIRWEGGNSVVIDSAFDSADAKTVFPTTVHVANSGSNTDIIDVKVARFESNSVIDQSRFEDASIGMPPNTMRSDYRNNRITGYWDGEKFREDPVSPRELKTKNQADSLKSKASWPRYLIAGVVVLVSGAIAIVVWMRRAA